MTVTEDGDLLAYKGVNVDGTSVHAGYGIVNGEEFEHANLPNEVGSVIEIPRSMVDTNRGAACSVGLHVGDYSYASSFARRLLTVVVNPRDVVSVPSDSEDRKVRVARYTVIGIAEEPISTPTYAYVGTEDAEDDEDELEDDLDYEEQYSEFDADEDDEDEEEELSDDEIYYNSKVEEFSKLIPELIRTGESLRRWRSKRVTSKARPIFDEVAEDFDSNY
jgi:hypothetical protein